LFIVKEEAKEEESDIDVNLGGPDRRDIEELKSENNRI
tara:strand:- start:487 stop:600 length:114 start_codon:yes stop_codon:yes gene_type:complete